MGALVVGIGTLIGVVLLILGAVRAADPCRSERHDWQMYMGDMILKRQCKRKRCGKVQMLHVSDHVFSDHEDEWRDTKLGTNGANLKGMVSFE